MVESLSVNLMFLKIKLEKNTYTYRNELKYICICNQLYIVHNVKA